MQGHIRHDDIRDKASYGHDYDYYGDGQHYGLQEANGTDKCYKMQYFKLV